MAAIRQVVVGGVGATLNLEDISRVARGEHVVIDTAAADRIKKESPAPSKGAACAPTPSNGPVEKSETLAATEVVPVTLSGEQARSAVLARLMSMVNGHSKVRCSANSIKIHLRTCDNDVMYTSRTCDVSVSIGLCEPGIGTFHLRLMKAGAG